MIFYFVVEGQNTEKRLYRKWIPYLLPNMSYVTSVSELTDNSFYIISCKGTTNYPAVLRNAWQDFESLGIEGYIFICVDSEELGYQEKFTEINNFVQENCPDINCETIIIVQTNCIESWLMGNKSIDISNPIEPELIEYRNYHNVNILDPENLTPIDDRTIGQFTYKYLQLMLQENGLHYTKRTTGDVDTQVYFERLVERNENDKHIRSFGYFLEEIHRVNNPH